jgi:hypothetical protein
MKFIFNDGGRMEAGYKGEARDCVTRSIAIAADLPYQDVYDAMTRGNSTQRKSKRSKDVKTAREGVHVQRKWFKDYMKSLGFEWVPTMGIGTGCKVHLRDGELPIGRLVVMVSRHSTAVIDGVINDTHNPSRNEWRCVYGYYILKN